jgi:hypothetical protein
LGSGRSRPLAVAGSAFCRSRTPPANVCGIDRSGVRRSRDQTSDASNFGEPLPAGEYLAEEPRQILPNSVEIRFRALVEMRPKTAHMIAN